MHRRTRRLQPTWLLRTLATFVCLPVAIGCTGQPEEGVGQQAVDPVELEQIGEEQGSELALQLADELQVKSAAVAIVVGKMAAVTAAINNGEIVQAELALSRAKRLEVKAYAAMIIAHHTAANAQQEEVLDDLGIAPLPNPVSATITAQAAVGLATLKLTPSFLFDRAYLKTQVVMHTQALTMIAGMIPVAPDPEFKSYLVELEDVVDDHLGAALLLLL